MTTPKKVKTGWQTQVYLGKDEHGKSRFKTITRQYKWQVVQEAEKLETQRVTISDPLTVKAAIKKYIELSNEVLSPTTLSRYEIMAQYSFQPIMDKEVSLLTDTDMQQAINEESKRICERTGKQVSAKTVKNEWGIVSSALKHFGYRYNIRLPKQAKKNVILPEPQLVIDAIKGSSIELPCLLAMWCSLRLGEVLGIRCTSIKGDVLCVDQVQIPTKEGVIEKPLAKTSASIRKVKIPPYVVQLINNTDTYIKYRETGENVPLIALPNSTLRHRFYALMDKANLDLSFHDLRHYFASISIVKLGIEDRLVQNVGGWKDSKILREVYNNEFNADQEIAFNKRNAYFETLLK